MNQFQKTKAAFAQNAIPLVWWTAPWFSMLIITWALLLPVYSLNQYYSRYSAINLPDDSSFALANVQPYLSYSYLYNKNKNSNLVSPLNKLIPPEIKNHKLLTNKKKNVPEERKEQERLALNGQKEDEQIMNPNEVLLNAADADNWKASGPMTKYKEEFKDYLGFFIPNTIRDQFVDYSSLMDQLRNQFTGISEKRLGNWNKLQSAWGKRHNEFDRKRAKWNELNGMWGKRSLTWNKMSSAWGKRKRSVLPPHWNKLRGMWGKRTISAGSNVAANPAAFG